jgi:ATP adenylyltransferase
MRRFLLNILYAPWRDKYINRCSEKKSEQHEACVFCEIWTVQDRDDETYVLARYRHVMVVLNTYPYAGGHLLVIPGDHISDLDLCSIEVRSEIIEVISAASLILKKILGAQGVNIGINAGKAAGAGIPDHLHVHLVPRWAGDTNFLPVIGQTKQISVDLRRVYDQLKKPFQEVKI